MLELNNITKIFNAGTVDETTLFDNFSFKLDEGEFAAVIGSNGSGKTTLLNLACGTIKPDGGTILFKGEDITKLPEHKRAKTIGRVLQDPRLGTCGNLTILENMALADNKNKPFGLGAGVNKKRVDYYKSLLEIKAGVVEGMTYDAAGITEVAKIPSREELLSRLFGSMRSPVANFARVLNQLAEKGGAGGCEAQAIE